MLRIAIVEDDPLYQQELQDYLGTFENEKAIEMEVSLFNDGDMICRQYNFDFDIILMDIEMKFMDGLSAARYIRDRDEEVVLIFITNMPQYVMKGYEVEALDYILKPIDYFSFSQKLERAINRMNRRIEKSILVNVKGGMRKVSVNLIRYIEVRDHDLIYHMKKEQIFSRGSSMRAVEKQMQEGQFYRCHNCYLVNLKYVEAFVDNEVLVDGERVLVSRSKKRGLIDALNDYIAEERK